MNRIILSLLFLLLSFGVTYADECLYDQGIYKAMYDELERTYTNAKYKKETNSLEIDLPQSTLIIWYGGCEHYGAEIEYLSKTKENYDDKSQLFEKVIDLTTLFGQHMIKPDELKEIFDNNKYEEIEPNVYIVFYPSMNMFSVTNATNSGKAHISITFYN